VRDRFAHAVVILPEVSPRNGAVVAEECARHAGDYRRLALELGGDRREATLGAVHDAHRILDRHELRPIPLPIDLGSAETG
jgi:hypothetical protein